MLFLSPSLNAGDVSACVTLFKEMCGCPVNLLGTTADLFKMKPFLPGRSAERHCPILLGSLCLIERI